MKQLISVAEADDIIASSLPGFPAEDVPLTDAGGRVLREDVRADRDLPPFDRVTMDGIAFRYGDYGRGARLFTVAGTHAAGDPAPRGLPSNGCYHVMTGAVLPPECDCVVRIEDVGLADGGAAVRTDATVRKGQNVHAKGSDGRAGAVLLDEGIRLTAPAIAVAATVGKATIRVARVPSVAIVSTGDELVDVGEVVAPHQIRRSNDYALAAAFRARGFARLCREHVADDPAALRSTIARLLDAWDVLVLTGGVSMGEFDYVPSVLQALHVKGRFHKVRQRPGKPFWFGMREERQPVFALPGNPVSAVVCLYRYVLPHLEHATGARRPQRLTAVLAEEVVFRPRLTYFMPVCLESDDSGTLFAVPRETNTSGDLAALAGSDGFVELAESMERFPETYPAPVFRWD